MAEIWIQIFLLSILREVNAQGNIWNGCIGIKNLEDTELCYNLTEPMDGLTAWQHCVSLNVTDEFRKSPTSRLLVNQLKQPPENGVSSDSVWIGGIEKYSGSASYVGYYGPLPGPDRIETESGRGCLALDPSSEFRIVRKDCDQKLRRICVYKKFETVIYNGNALDACGDGQIAALQGCYKVIDSCEKERFLMCPKPFIGADNECILSSDLGSDIDYINNITLSKSPMIAELYKMVTIKGEWIRNTSKDETDMFTDGIELCFESRGTAETIRFELRHNKTAEGLTLWVGGRGRMAEWPPKCVGGRVEELPPGAEDASALRVILSEEAEEVPIVWCYALDIITGTIAVSNSVSLRIFDTCTEDPIKGIPAGTIVDERASCLQCLRSVLIMCNDTETCPKGCYEDGSGCSHFGISAKKWETVLDGSGDMDELKRCANNETCAVTTYWQLSEGKDCNRDGYDDCDDRFARIFDQSCSKDPREFKVLGPMYWKCRTNTRRDFVDFQSGNTTVRFYCENNLHLGRSWSFPKFISGLSPYAHRYIPPSILEVSSSTEVPFYGPVEPLKLKQAKETLRKLHSIEHKDIETTKEITNIVQDFSNLLHVNDDILGKAMRYANVSSISKLLENILINVPIDVNVITENLAVFKKNATGFQLLSNYPSVNDSTLGAIWTQIPITREADIKGKEKQVEVAVLIPDVPDNVSLVVVTYVKKSEFIPCRPPVMSDARESQNASNDHSSSSGYVDADDKNSTPLMELSEDYCPSMPGIIRGCMNTLVVQVGLLSSNGSYVQLEPGKHVDIMFKTEISPLLYQRKQCVYWHTEKRGWAYDGCALHKEKDGLDTCRCSHLTHFAQLITDADVLTGPDAEYLRIITIICGVVSLMSFIGVIVFGATVTEWSKKKENKIMINLAASFSLYLGFFLYCAISSKPALDVAQCSNLTQQPSPFCKAKGIALHYLVLSSFCWMFMASTTHYLRITNYNQIPINHYVLKSMLVGWCVPVLPVAILILADLDAYVGKGRNFCYPTGVAFYCAVLLPVLVVFISNGIMFFLIQRIFFPNFFSCCNANPKEMLFKGTKKQFYRKIVATFVYTFLFGLTWYIGLFPWSVVPAYFVSFSVGLQGPLLFLIFVIGEENNRNKLCLVCGKFKPTTKNMSSTNTSTINESNF